MCGGTLLQPPATPVAAQAGSSQASGGSVPARRADSSSSDTPVISGPSFLGLNQPAPRKRGSLSIDPRSSKSVDLDYLLEDEDDPHSGTGWKFAVMIVALALAVGFGILRWRNHTFPWLQSQSNKPSAQVPDATDSGSPAPDAATPAPNNSTPSPAAPQPAASAPASAPATSPAQQSAAPPAQNPPAPAAQTPTPAQTAPETAASQPPADDTPAAKPAQDSQPAPTQDAAKNDSDSDDGDTAAPVEKPKPSPAHKAEVKHAAPADPVAEAQKYLYGKGAAQDCDRGMRILKPAANQANAKAMVELGALYSAGLCTPRDLPTAYRWFAMALRKDPDNESIQTDLSKLWGEMTQPERQLAIRLTQ